MISKNSTPLFFVRRIVSVKYDREVVDFGAILGRAVGSRLLVQFFAPYFDGDKCTGSIRFEKITHFLSDGDDELEVGEYEARLFSSKQEMLDHVMSSCEGLEGHKLFLERTNSGSFHAICKSEAELASKEWK